MQDLDINSGGGTNENEHHYLLEPSNDQPYDFVNFESQNAHRLPPQRQQPPPTIMPGSPQAPNDKTSQQMAAWYDTDL